MSEREIYVERVEAVMGAAAGLRPIHLHAKRPLETQDTNENTECLVSPFGRFLCFR